MIDSEILTKLGLSGYLLPAWTVIVYVILSSVLVLIRRIPLYLLTTHVFTVYWGFVLYWGDYLSGVNSYMTAFAVYTFCSLAIASLAIASY
ncbi:MAG: hypothetical protein ACE5I0_09850, partial [Candidatus Binatia bacterium]